MSSISGRTTPPSNSDAKLYDDDDEQDIKEEHKAASTWLPPYTAPPLISRPTAAYLNPPGTSSGHRHPCANDEALARAMQAEYDAMPCRVAHASEADFKQYPDASNYRMVEHKLRNRGKVSILDSLKQVQPQLAMLDMLYLGNQFVDDKTLPDLLNFITTACPSLRFLDLSHNSLTDVSSETISQYLPNLNQLVFLNLHGNLFTKQACSKVCKAQTQHPSVIPVGIEGFDAGLLNAALKKQLQQHEKRMWAVNRVLQDLPAAPAAMAKTLKQLSGWIGLSATLATQTRRLWRAASEPMEILKVFAWQALNALSSMGRIMAPHDRRSQS